MRNSRTFWQIIGPYPLREKIFLTLINSFSNPEEAFKQGMIYLAFFFSKAELRQAGKIFKPLARLLKAEFKHSKTSYAEQLAAVQKSLTTECAALSNQASSNESKKLMQILTQIEELSSAEQLEMFNAFFDQEKSSVSPGKQEFNDNSDTQLLQNLFLTYSKLINFPNILSGLRNYVELKRAYSKKITSAQEFLGARPADIREFLLHPYSSVEVMQWLSPETKEFCKDYLQREDVRLQLQAKPISVSVAVNAFAPEERAKLVEFLPRHTQILNHRMKYSFREKMAGVFAVFLVFLLAGNGLWSALNASAGGSERVMQGAYLAIPACFIFFLMLVYTHYKSLTLRQEQQHFESVATIFAEQQRRATQTQQATPATLENGEAVNGANDEGSDEEASLLRHGA